MRIRFFAIATLSCIGVACAVTDVDDLFDPTSTGGASGKGGAGGQTGGSGGGGTGGTGGSGGSTGGTGGTGGATGGTGGSGGTGGATGGTGGTGGATGGTGGTGGVAGTGGTGGIIVDSGADVHRDAADVRDAGKAGIRCGSATCDPATQFCCFGSSSTRCVANTSTTCSASNDRLHCDDAADCLLGQICCASQGSSGNGADAVCTLTTLGCAAPKNMLCDPTTTAPCLNIMNLVCSANGSGIFEDYAYCHAP